MAASKLSSAPADSPPAVSSPSVVTPFRRGGQSRCFLDERSLVCDICLEVIYNAVSVAPCNHKFCAACILQWADRNDSCPKCRNPIRGMTRDSFAQQIIDEYLQTYPERVRPQERLTAADKAELRYLEKLMDDDDDEDSLLRVDWLEDDSFDDFDETIPANRRRVYNAYTRDEYTNRIQRLHAMGVASPPPVVPAAAAPGVRNAQRRNNIRVAVPVPPADDPMPFLLRNIRNLQNTVFQHLPPAGPPQMPVVVPPVAFGNGRHVVRVGDNLRVVAGDAARPAPPPPPLPPQQQRRAPANRRPARVVREAEPRAADPPPDQQPADGHQMVTRSQARRQQNNNNNNNYNHPYQMRARRQRR